MSKPVKFVSTKTPSIQLSIVIILIYLFAIMPLIAGIMYVSVLFEYPLKIIRLNLSESILIAQICLTTTMIYYIVSRYSDYLFSHDWKANFIKYLRVGLKWSIPLLLFHVISLSIPTFREKLIQDYLTMKIITVRDISNFSFIIFSIWMILGAIFEELYFRGIILQKLQPTLNSYLSIFIAAGLFSLSHFVFSPMRIGELTSVFIIGLLCGFAYTASGSCISAIVPHLMNNAISVGVVSVIR